VTTPVPNGTVLVIDVGTSSVRAAAVGRDGTVAHERQRATLPVSPAPGLVEFDPAAIADAALELARAVLAEAGPVAAVGIANQRASTVLWDRATGEALGPGLGWQDLRTVGDCLVLAADGIRLAPNLSATKLAHLLGLHDPERERDLCFGTVDSWIAWHLTGGASHVIDTTNAALTGLRTGDQTAWDDKVLGALRIPEAILPTVVDSIGVVGDATALDGSPPIAGLLGDQQASLLGQGCVRAGDAKVTFGTGGMLDVCLDERPDFPTRGRAGTFPIVARSRDGIATWGIEAVMLAAGTNVEWLRDDLGLIPTAAASHDVAAACDDTGGVAYVPALLGLGAPTWDYGARGALLGLTRGSGRPQIVRAVLEGIAQRGADLVDAAVTDGAIEIPALRVDGGMSANPTFLQAVADAAQRPVEVSPVTEATTVGAAYAAGIAVGTWSGLDEVASLWAPRATVEPARVLDRERWADTVRRAAAWHPDLSSIDF
jgi:glycerol kinase